MEFEPFQDRLSRDIRNDLAATMIVVLEKLDTGPAQKIADQYLCREIKQYHKSYIHDRLARYRSAVEIISSGPPDDVFWRSFVLWDHRLFFEVHELLEHAWHNATGTEKKILQAMIRAAGVYIKLEYGYAKAAQKMAGRSLPVLRKHRKFLARYFDPERLFSALQECSSEPPKLLD